MGIPLFDNVWFAEMIERFRTNTEGLEINVAIDCHGNSIFAAACVIAQSIDALTKAIEKAKAD